MSKLVPHLISLIESSKLVDGSLIALKCLHHIVFFNHDEASKLSQEDYINSSQDCTSAVKISPQLFASLQRISLSILKNEIEDKTNKSLVKESQVYSCCLSILYNLTISSPDQLLGSIVVNACYHYSFYGVPHSPFQKNLNDEELPNSCEASASSSWSESETDFKQNTRVSYQQ